MPQITHVPAICEGVLVHLPLFSRRGIVIVNGRRLTVADLHAPVFATKVDAMAARFPNATVDPKAFGSTWRSLLRQRDRYAASLRQQLS